MLFGRVAALFLPLVGASLASTSTAAQCASFAVMPSTKRASAAQRLSSKADPASVSTGSTSNNSSRTKKQKLKPEDSALVASGDELVRVSRRLHERLKGEEQADVNSHRLPRLHSFFSFAELSSQGYGLDCVLHAGPRLPTLLDEGK